MYRSIKGKEVVHYSMNIDKDVIGKARENAQKNGLCTSSYIEKLILADDQKEIGVSATNVDIEQLKAVVNELAGKISLINDKVDCINIIVTKLSAK